MDIRIETETRGAIEAIQQKFKKELSEREILRGTAQAINGTLNRCKTKIKKPIAAEYNITSKALGKMADVRPKAQAGSLYAGLRLSYAPIPIIGFRPKQTPTGVSVTIRKGKPVAIKSAFLATMKSGHTGVFARGQYGKGKGKGFQFENTKTSGGKVRITQLQTASPFTMGLSKKVAREVSTFMQTEAVRATEGILKSKVDKLGK